jgi:putative aldouronate transport system substrate-binding protein
MKTFTGKRLLVILIAIAMFLSLTACGGTTQGSNDDSKVDTKTPTTAATDKTEDTQKIEKVTMYPGSSATPSGLVEGYKAKVFAERGLEVEVWAFSDERTNAILASGDLPDVMYIDYERLVNMIEGGLVMDLEPHLSKMPHVANNPDIQTALNYTRQYRSADTGKIYALPLDIGVPIEKDDCGRNGVKVNWEVYYDIGTPKVDTFDDLIPLMKQMMEHKPVADDGTKTWGTILNSGSDGTYWGNMQMWYRFQGYNEGQLAYLIETDMVNGEYISILEANRDSLYYDGLKWYNKAYREGVMDPDSINNDRETQKAKVERSHACMVPSGSLAGWGGYRQIYIPGTEVNHENWDSPFGRDTYIVANANTKNLDATLRMLDTLSDPEAFFQIWTGTEEEGMWEYGPDGKIVPTEYGLEATVAGAKGEEIIFTNGEKQQLWNDGWVIRVPNDSPHLIGPDGQPRITRTMNEWVEVKEITDNTEDFNQWREALGYKNYTSLLKAKDAYTLVSELDFVNSFVSTPDDIMRLTLSAIKDVVVDASWLMVYSETDEEFEALWDRMIKKCTELGAEEIVNWRMDDLANALKIKNSLMAN